MSNLLLPSPIDLGLPEQFSDWRPGQPEAILHATDADERFTGLVLPTGFGKSLVYMAIAWLLNKRTVILTSTKALQRQLIRDFELLQALLVQGQRNYICRALEPGGELYSQFGEPQRVGAYPPTCDQGPCHFSVDCGLHDAGCSYFDAVRAATAGKIVITNYAWWMSLVKQPGLVMRPELLVCDEAHDSPDALSDAIGTEIPHQLYAQVLTGHMPAPSALDGAGWQGWAAVRVQQVGRYLENTQARTRDAVIGLRRAKTLLRCLERVAAIDPSLLLVSESLDGLKFDIVWAATFSEEYLFRHVPKVILTSATMTSHTADLLGIMGKDLSMYEAGDGFPLGRRPVYVAPARKPPFGEPLANDHRMSEDSEQAWLDHVDRIIAARRDRKGIIHTVSYRRRDLIIARSTQRDRMMTHGRHDTSAQIAKFKTSPPGTVLVSPAVTTGYDFPYEECEFQILAKIPFPDRRDQVTAARTLVDSLYPNHIAMQELVQSIGRGMRAEDDQCESFIVDAHAIWFLSKHAKLAPRWFRRAVRRLDAGTIPAPPPPLGSRSSRVAV